MAKDWEISMNHDVCESLAYANHLLAEHRRVHGMLSRIEQQWSLTSDGPQSSGNIAALRERIEELRSELAKHFAEEEAGGVLEEAATRCPDLGREEIQLAEEHTVLLADLDRIVAGICTATRVGLVPGELKAAFERFVDQLKAHEAAENRLLEQGFNIDLN
jgi:hypothetical protein